MPRYYADLDNNRLLAGPITTQIAPQPSFYSGNTVSVGVDMIQRDTLQNLQNYAPATGTTVSLILGSSTTVISVPALVRTNESGISATATCSLYSTITATATASLWSVVTAAVTASLFGNITAKAAATVTRGSVCTLSLSVVSVRTPSISYWAVTSAYEDLATTAGLSQLQLYTINPVYRPVASFTHFKNSSNVGYNYVRIDDQGQDMYGAQVYYCKDSNTTTTADSLAATLVTDYFTFKDGKLVDVNPAFIDANDNMMENLNFYDLRSRIIFVPDPDSIYCAKTVTVVSGGTGFPDGVNIPFSIPSDDGTDGLPCTGFVRAVNGSVVSVVSISSRGSGFTSSTTTGKTSVVTPFHRISSISVTCAGAGYWGSAPAITIDNLYYDSAVAGASPAVASALTSNGIISAIRIDNPGYGYTTTPGVIIAQARLTDGVRIASLTNVPTGYSDGTYACEVGAPAAGVPASVSLVVTSGQYGLIVEDSGQGYTAAPTVTAPAPDLASSIRSISVACAGLGYVSAPTVTITGSGQGASASAVLAGGKISGITVVCGGSGYAGIVTVSIDPSENQGKIQSVSIVTAGTNYISEPAVSFSGGGGSGAAASTLVFNGSVTTIQLSSEGSGYASAPAVVLDASPTRTIFSGVLTVTTAFYTAASASSNLMQVNLTTTAGITTVLQTPAKLSASL